MLTEKDHKVFNKALKTLDDQKKIIDLQRQMIVEQQNRMTQMQTIIAYTEQLRIREMQLPYVRSLN